jgi:hypothetical protein
MKLYTAYDRIIASDLTLPLPEAAEGRPSVTCSRWHATPPNGEGEAALVHEHTASTDELVYRLERRNGHYRWWYPWIGTFRIARDGRRLEWDAKEESRADAGAALSGPILGFAIQLQGQTSLHGSALATEAGAFGLLAPSHFGKSTLAAALMLKGCRLLTDDVVALKMAADGPRVLPGYANVKLWPDALAHHLPASDVESLPRHASWLDKRLVKARDLGEVCESEQPLRALFLLAPTREECETAAKRLTGVEALMGLLSQAYNAHLLSLETELLARQSDELARALETVSVYRLRYQRGLERLDGVAEAVLSLVGGRCQ